MKTIRQTVITRRGMTRCPFHMPGRQPAATHLVRWHVQWLTNDGYLESVPTAGSVPVVLKRWYCRTCAHEVARYQRSMGVRVHGPYRVRVIAAAQAQIACALTLRAQSTVGERQ